MPRKHVSFTTCSFFFDLQEYLAYIIYVIVSIGIYHQFDTIIYPPLLQETHEKSWREAAAQKWEAVKDVAKSAKKLFWGESSAGHERDGPGGATAVPNKNEFLSKDALRQKSLQCYLSEYITGFNQGSLPQWTNVDQSVDHISHMYECITNLTLHDGQSYSQPWPWANARQVSSVWISNTLCQCA